MSLNPSALRILGMEYIHRQPSSPYCRSGELLLPLSAHGVGTLYQKKVPYLKWHEAFDFSYFSRRQEEIFLCLWTILKELDALLACRISDVTQWGLRPFQSLFWRIQYFVHSLLAYSQLIRALTDSYRPETIIWEGETSEKSVWEGSLRSLRDISMYALIRVLWRRYGAEKGISWRDEPVEPISPLDPQTWKRRILPAKLIPFLKPLQHALRYQWWPRGLTPPRLFSDRNLRTSRSVLCLGSGARNMDIVITRLLNAGVHVWVQEGKRYYHLRGGIKSIPDEAPPLDSAISRNVEWEKALSAAEVEAALQPLDQYAGFPVSWLAKNFFIRSLTEDFPQLLQNVLQKKHLLNRLQAEAVLVRAAADMETIAWMEAARLLGIPRISFQHGNTFVNHIDWPFYELLHVDKFFTMDPPSRVFFEHAQKKYPADLDKPKVFCSAHYLKAVRHKAREVLRKNKKIVFVPRKYTRSGLNVFHFDCPETGYLEQQLCILAYFAKKPAYQFLYKYAVGQKWAEDILNPFVRSIGCKNIEFSDQPFIDCLPQAACVLMDFPSTACFEALAAGIPVLAGYPYHWPLRDELKEMGKDLFQPYASTDEWIEKMEHFLGQRDKLNFHYPVETFPEFSPDEIFTATKSTETEKKLTNATC